eukprot:TRINITY_DN16895_c0_g1_i5.p1 TRINITY_DN16895_c0_g1~~TRINITY_DN16895_c0_g1_i5.p1  ORF type:complete len:153 (-),score=0.73 TRINITY_DN16895_c0_g1_i5:156-614(-)
MRVWLRIATAALSSITKRIGIAVVLTTSMLTRAVSSRHCRVDADAQVLRSEDWMEISAHFRLLTSGCSFGVALCRPTYRYDILQRLTEQEDQICQYWFQSSSTSVDLVFFEVLAVADFSLMCDDEGLRYLPRVFSKRRDGIQSRPGRVFLRL